MSDVQFMLLILNSKWLFAQKTPQNRGLWLKISYYYENKQIFSWVKAHFFFLLYLAVVQKKIPQRKIENPPISNCRTFVNYLVHNTVFSVWIQVKSYSTIGFFIICFSLRVTFTKTNSYEILSRALFEKYEKNINFSFVLNEEFFNSSRPLFWWQICNPDVISFHLIGRTICFYEEIKISIFKPPL